MRRDGGPGQGLVTATTRPLDLCIVAPYGVLGGAERWLLTLLGATNRLRVEAVLLKDGPLRTELEHRGVPVAVHETGRSLRQVLGAAGWLSGRLRHRRPDVVLANGVKAAVAAVPAGRATGVPVVWAKHDHSFDRWLARPLARLSDRVVAAVEELAEPTGRQDVVIVPPPRPDRDPASRRKARRFWASRGVKPTADPILVVVSRLVPYKGVDDTIAALRFPAAAPWRLVVVGPDDPAAPGERRRLERFAAEQGVAERVRFTGEVPDAGHWLAAFDALAAPTRRDRGGPGAEGFGTSAFEAMWAGIPVIAVDGGAVARRLAGRGGIVVPPGSPRALAAGLDALSSPSERARTGAAARELIAEHPDAATCAVRLTRVLAEAASRPGAGLAAGPPVTVVTPVLNEGAAVDELLEPLVAQLGGQDEVVVVDAGSSDDSRSRAEAWARRDHRVRVVVAPGASVGRGRNVGATEAKNDVIACTDAGCTPSPRWIDAFRTAFAESPPPSIVSGVYRVMSRTPFEDAVAAAGYPDPDEARRPGPLARAYGRLLGRTFDPARPDGRSVAFSRAAWRDVGGFLEHLPATEDMVFARSVGTAGGRSVLNVDAEVTWAEPLSPSRVARRWFKYGLGDGASGDRTAITRNVARALAYLITPALIRSGGRVGKTIVIGGGILYLSLPLVRALRRPRPMVVAALVPVALAVKDLMKASGCLVGLARRLSAGSAHRPGGLGEA